MARVSVILPLERASVLDEEQVAGWRKTLENAGHSVEFLAVVDPRALEDPAESGEDWRATIADEPGLVAGARLGLAKAQGDVLVVVDHVRGYTADDLVRVVEPIARREAELAVATRRLRFPGAGALARRVAGSADPLSGLLAVARGPASEPTNGPAGSFLTLEMLARTARRTDVLVHSVPIRPRRPLALDDVRHLKRLADDRFGNASRLVQFCMVGASGMVVDLSSYALFQLVFSRTPLAALRTPVLGGSLALAVSGALAIALALTWNFSLNRRLTFSYARRGSILRQFVGYALSNALGIGLSFVLRLFLPAHVAFFNRHRLAAALVGIVSATGISFSMSRWLVFGKRHEPEPAEDTLVGASGGAGKSHAMSRGLSASSCELL